MSALPAERRTDAGAARDVARAAGELLLEIREGLGRGTAADEVRREGDLRSNELIVSLLRDRFPDDAVLTEESAGLIGSDAAERLWIVDPLDGTREFGEAGRDDWAVHVALVEGGALRAGAVALPASPCRMLCSEDVRAPEARPDAPVRVVASRTRAVPEAHAIAAALGAELVPMGSAGAKIAAVVRGDADVYVHSGGQYVWDSAAPVAVASAAGLHASRLDGAPLAYDGGAWLPDLVVCRDELRERVLEILRGDCTRAGSGYDVDWSDTP